MGESDRGTTDSNEAAVRRAELAVSTALYDAARTGWSRARQVLILVVIGISTVTAGHALAQLWLLAVGALMLGSAVACGILARENHRDAPGKLTRAMAALERARAGQPTQ